MAIQIIDGFDLYNGTGANTGLQAKWAPFSGRTANLSLVAGRDGGQAVSIAAGGSTTYTNIARTLTATASIGLGFAMRFITNIPTVDNPAWHVSLLNGSTYTLGLRVTTTGALQVYRATGSAAGTSLGTSATGLIVLNTWVYVEMDVTIHDTTGSVTLKVDGTTVLTLTAQDTNNAVTNVDTVALGHSDNSVNGTIQFDDVYVTNGGVLGIKRIETLYPTSDVAQGFARSTGATNYTLVDEAQVNGDTDYVQGSTVGNVDTYGFIDMNSTPPTVSAIQLTAFALKTDATGRSIALQCKSGATTSDGSNYSLATTYSKFDRILETDPNTAAAWTAANVNAATGGPKVTV